jgi:hypothetical protein
MRYSKILSKVKKTAKAVHLNNQIFHSNNKIKTTWNSIRSETGGNNINYDKLNTLNADKEYNKNVKVENFNNYFLTIAKNISCKITGSHKQIINCTKYSLSYLSQAFNLPFTNIVFHNTSKGRLKKIIHSFPWKFRVGMMKFQGGY